MMMATVVCNRENSVAQEVSSRGGLVSQPVIGNQTWIGIAINGGPKYTCKIMR